MLYPLIRRCLFMLEPEVAHRVALTLLDKSQGLLPNPKADSKPTEIMGLTFPNRVGLAAGLDKNGAYISALGKLGFGFIEVGTVTPQPQVGNPQPRLFRLPHQKALINRMGFNNAGVEQLVSNVEASSYAGIIGINIGKNKNTANADANADYLSAMQQVYPYADYIALNISSPNTPGLRDLQNQDSLKSLLHALKSAQQQLSREFTYKPLVVKIAPDLSDAEVTSLADTLVDFEIDGVIATNTSLDKRDVTNAKHGQEDGGLSGQPLLQHSTHVLEVLADAAKGRLAIIGVGGIMSGKDAEAKITAGADLVQIYSGLIYQGPQLLKDINQTLSRR